MHAMNGGSSTLLSIKDATKTFQLGQHEVPVLTGVNLKLEAGETCAIMGPSGVGKSTLLNIIAGLETTNRGAVHLFGQDLAQLSDNQRTKLRRGDIGMIYQFFNLVPNLTVRENIELPYLIDNRIPDTEEVTAAIESVGIGQRTQHFPAQLSGGEMQLVSIARAMVRKPRLILADEPTGNVNVATGKLIMKILLSAAKDSASALLLVTHNPEDAAKANRVVFMLDGKIDTRVELSGNEVSSAAIHKVLSELEI
jgi:putative ABC transport system ATP-binding protein